MALKKKIALIVLIMATCAAIRAGIAAVFLWVVPEDNSITVPADAPNTLPVYDEGTGMLTLIADGTSEYTIVYGAGAAHTEQLAAQELQSYLRQITGVLLPLTTDSAPARTAEIIVGKTNRAADAQIARPVADEDSYTIALQGETLLIAGGETRGTLYGVYDFLQDFFGCRFFTPSLELVPQQRVAAIPKNANISGAPAFSFRHTSWNTSNNARWRSKLHLNGTMTAGHGSVDESDTKLILFDGVPAGHTMEVFVPAETYFESHPEYFMMNEEGVREPMQLCYANPDVLELTKQTIAQWIADHPQANIFSVSQNDGHYNCHCPECAAMDEAEGSPSGALLNFVNKVAVYADSLCPGVLIHTFAYQATERPPRNIRPADNVLVQLCSIGNNHSVPYAEGAPQFCVDVKTWSEISNNLILWDYGTTFSCFLTPFPDLKTLQPNAQMYKENGAQGYFMQGNRDSVSAEFGELRAYLIAKLMWDPDMDFDAATREFLYYYYGPGYTNMEEYIRRIEAKRQDFFRIGSLREEFVKLNVFDLAQAEAWFDACEALTLDADQLEHVQRSRLQVIWYKSVFKKAEFSFLNPKRAEENRKLHEALLHHGISHLQESNSMVEQPDYRKTPDSWTK